MTRRRLATAAAATTTDAPYLPVRNACPGGCTWPAPVRSLRPDFIREGNHGTWKLCSAAGDVLVRLPNRRAARAALVRAEQAWSARQPVTKNQPTG